MLILQIWEKQPGDYFFISTKSADKKWYDKAFHRSELKKVREYIEDNLDKDVYWCPHGFSKPFRQKRFSVPPFLLWADLDEANPSEIPVKPSVAWESSPGRYACVWLVDEKITDSVNQRLTQFVGADPGGWDYTQVLRVPGTRNYKYSSSPKVRYILKDGPSYSYKELIKSIPKAKETKKDEHDSSAIFKKYEKQLSPFVRKELLNGKPQIGKRSEVFWKLANELIESGVSREEAKLLLANSVWNKFKGRSDEDRQLNDAIEKAVEEKFSKKDTEEEPYKYLSKTLEDYDDEETDWIIPGWLAASEVNILQGDPGIGKSQLAQYFAGCIADGRTFPTDKRMKPVVGSVALFDPENSPSIVTRKRMRNNGFKCLNKIFCEVQSFQLDDEATVNYVMERLDSVKDLKLVIFDTIGNFTGSVDTHKGSDVTKMFYVLKQIAIRKRCSVLVLAHLNKSKGNSALYKGMGSIASAGAARIVNQVAKHPVDENVLVLSQVKNNLGPHQKSRVFTIENLPDLLNETDRCKIIIGDTIDLSADDVLNSDKHKEQKPDDLQQKIEACIDWLDMILGEGPVEAVKVQTASDKKGFSKRVLQSACETMGVIKDKKGFGGKSYWGLPGSTAKKDTLE